jgi:plasmid stabilization system protein ParE
MEEGKGKVVFGKRAIRNIGHTAIYIESKGFPDNAIKFANELFDFGQSLADFPEKYPVCRKKNWAKRNLRCAIFKKDYIFIYRVSQNELIIYNVVHTRTIV